jgi:hypothetical protein
LQRAKSAEAATPDVGAAFCISGSSIMARRRLSPEEGALFDAIKLKRLELVALAERVDVAEDEDAERDRLHAIQGIDENVGRILGVLTRPPRD